MAKDIERITSLTTEDCELCGSQGRGRRMKSWFADDAA